MTRPLSILFIFFLRLANRSSVKAFQVIASYSMIRARPTKTESSLLLQQAASSAGGSGNNDNKNNKSFEKYRPEEEGTTAFARTYGVAPIKDVIDTEGAMAAFFSSREEWLPLFRFIAGSDLPPDTASLLESLVDSSSTADSTTSVDPRTTMDWNEGDNNNNNNNPWRRLEAIPQHEDDRAVLAKFLDSMHQSLLAIPVNEVADPDTADDDDDDDDVHFLEEGRRMLCLNRFHVLRENRGGTVESVDALFVHCWSELLELSRGGTAHTGSIILLPDYHSLSDLQRFADMNLIRPLEWLGVQSDFEVVSLQRDSPAIRLLYKLNDMPAGTYTEEEGFAAGTNEN